MSERLRTSLRPCGIENMTTLSDAERSADTRFRELWRAASTPSVQAFDYTRPRVDCGFRGSHGLAHAFDAQDELVRVREYVGERAFLVLKVAAGEQGSMSEVAAALGVPDPEAARMMASRAVKKALRALVDFWSKKGGSAGIVGTALPVFTSDDDDGARLGGF